MEKLTTKEAADLLGYTVRSLYSLRSMRRGPPVHGTGRDIYYIRQELEAYQAESSPRGGNRRQGSRKCATVAEP